MSAELERLRQIEDPLRRRLLVVGMLSEAHEGRAPAPINVGGAALEFYTLASYTTGDVDLISPAFGELGRILAGWDFRRRGGHWWRDGLGLAIETLAGPLAGNEGRTAQVRLEVVSARVIGIEDLIVDRLNAYVHWRSQEDGAWALHLMRLQKDP